MKQKLWRKLVRLMKGHRPNDLDEFLHNKRLEETSFNLRKITVLSLILLLIVSILIFVNPEQSLAQKIEVFIVCSVAVLVILLFGFLYSRGVKVVLEKIWKWRKNGN